MPRLAPFVRQHQAAIISRWEQTTRYLATASRLDQRDRIDNLPLLVAQIADTAEAAMQTQAAQLPRQAPQLHALNRLGAGYELAEVVAEYSALREAVLEVWQEQLGVRMDVGDVSILNRILDNAIAISVDRFVEARDRTFRALDRVTLAVLDPEAVPRSLDTTLTALAHVLIEAMAEVDTIFILLREDDTLRVRAVAGMAPATLDRLSVDIGEGFSGRVAAERRPLLIDVATDPLMLSQVMRARGTRAMYGVPLLDEDQLIGVAHMSSRTHADFSEEDKLVFRAMAARVTSFLVQAQLHERLQQSEEEFRTLTATLPEGVWTADRQGKLTYVNDVVPDLGGVAPERLLERGYEDFIHPEDLPASGEAWKHSVTTGEPFEVAHRLKAKDGTYRWHLARARALKDASGRPTKWIGTSTDIHDLREAQAELQRRADFEQHLIGIVSHDLRSPVTSITLNAQQLLRQDHLEARQTTAIVRILNAAERAGRMIADLLDFTKARLGGIPVVRRPVNLHELVQRALDEIHVGFADRQLIVEHQGDGEGEWDADRLAQIVSNLTRNAFTYSPPDTPVRVTTRAEDGHVVLEVHNEGDPIPAEKQARIFEPMQRATVTGGERRNIGLGLYIVCAVVRAHGGDVSVQSTREQGTTFTVRLPRHPESSQELAATGECGPGTSGATNDHPAPGTHIQ